MLKLIYFKFLKLLRLLGYKLLDTNNCKIKNYHYSFNITKASLTPWENDKKFIQIYEKIKKKSLLEKEKIFLIKKIFLQLKKINGVIVDVGTYNGAIAELLNYYKSNHEKIYAFDTLKGVANISNYDTHYRGGEHKSDYNEIVKLISKKIKFVKCNFPNVKNKKILRELRFIKFCHLDVNSYLSTKRALNFFKDRIVKNGIIVCDDYGMFGVPGATKAIDIFIKKNNNFLFIYNLSGQAILIKTK